MFGFFKRTKRKFRCNRYNEDSQWQYLDWNLGRNADHTNIENTYPLDITPKPKDFEKEGKSAHTEVNKRSRRKEAHDDDSVGCDGGKEGGGGGGNGDEEGGA